MLEWLLKETGVNARDWVDLVQDMNYWSALMNAGLNPRVPEAMELI